MRRIRQTDSKESLIGAMIEIPSWRTFGMVVDQRLPHIGSDDAVEVLVQEHPDDPPRKFKWYRLEPEEFTIEG